MKNKILITIPSLESKGGVVNYYQNINLDKESNIDYFDIKNSSQRFIIFRLLMVYYSFWKQTANYSLIVLNPSLDIKAFLRDGLFVILSKLKNKKVIVFWHGWRNDFQESIIRNPLLSNFFNITFKRVDGFILLGNKFKQKLISLGISPDQEVYFEKMPLKKEWLLKDIKQKNISTSEARECFDILFLSRVIKTKRVDICIDVAKILMEKYPDKIFNIHIAGDGDQLEAMKRYAINKEVTNVKFYGHVAGAEKESIYQKSDIFLLPTETEGFPNVLVEALFWGLPIVTRPEGAIPNIVRHGENGYLTTSFEPKDFVKYIEASLFKEPKERQDIAEKCHLEAKEKYAFTTLRKNTLYFLNNFN